MQSEFRIASREPSGKSKAYQLGIMDEIADHVAEIERRPLRVLDAGAGRALRLKLPTQIHVTGIDISEETLNAHTALNERIVGDLQTYPLAADSFDVIVCWDVLEHLSDPLSAVENMSRALAEGGLLVLGGPNVWSPKGLITKFTPHRFHVFVYRHLLHVPDAGKPGFAPFPTYLRFSIAPKRLSRESDRLGLKVVMLRYYTVLELQTRLLRLPWKIITSFARLAPFGDDVGESDFCIVLKKLTSQAQ